MNGRGKIEETIRYCRRLKHSTLSGQLVVEELCKRDTFQFNNRLRGTVGKFLLYVSQSVKKNKAKKSRARV